MTGRRIVWIWLPQFPMERWRARQERLGNAPGDDLPRALSTEGPHGPVVHAANRPARLAGVAPGARVVDMRALCPALGVEPADPAGDLRAMERLALWARRWCPWTAAEPDGLVMDTTGSEHLHGGERAMLTEIEGRLGALGFSARPAVAPTRGAAWALARFGATRPVARQGSDLHPLPVAALRLGEETVLLLNRLGLKTVGDLAALPRLALARRFARAAPAENPLIRLDQAMGRLPEPLAPPDAPPVFRADLRLAEPMLDPAPALPGLTADLCRQLAAQYMGARRIRLTVWRSDGETRAIGAAIAAPSRDPLHLASLFRDRLERLDPGFGFDQVALEATVTEPLSPAQHGLEGRVDAAAELARLADRLAVRFGPRALTRLEPRESHIPERAEARVAPDPKTFAQNCAEAPRPLRLLDPAEEVRVVYAVPEGPPAQFLWRRQTHRVARWQGPERIAPEWWRDRPGTRLRDYFRVEDDRGRRYWLYREGLPGDGRGGDPRWFLHGIFA